MKRLMVACAALAAVLPAFANMTVSESYALSSGQVLEIDVPSGETYTYSGVISGAGSVKKTGLGTLVLSGANTYSGGFDLVAGKVQVATAVAFGTGTVTVSGSLGHSGANLPQIFFKTPNGTTKDKYADIGNNFLLTGSDALANDDYPLFMFDANTRLYGSITSDVEILRLGSSSGTSSQLAVQLRGKIARSNNRTLSVHYRVIGNAYINEAIAFKNLKVGVTYSGAGKLYLYNPNNTFTGTITLRRANLVCGNVNVLNGASLTWSNEATGSLELNSFDQTIKSISDAALAAGQSDDVRPITCSWKTATLTVGGATGEPCSYSLIKGPVSLVMDGGKDRMQKFGVRQHTTTGSIRVKSGILGASSQTTFKNVPDLRIDEDGEFRLCDSCEACFAGVTNLAVYGKFDGSKSIGKTFESTMKSVTLGKDATFILPSGQTIVTESLTIGNKTHLHGTFTRTRAPQLSEGVTVRVVGPASGLSLFVR